MEVNKQQKRVLNLPENQELFAPQTLSEFTLNRIAIIQSTVAKLSLMETESVQRTASLNSLQRINLKRNF